MNDKNITLDAKTKAMVISLMNHIQETHNKLDAILQAVINTKFPESNDKYKLSDDNSTLEVENDESNLAN